MHARAEIRIISIVAVALVACSEAGPRDAGALGNPRRPEPASARLGSESRAEQIQRLQANAGPEFAVVESSAGVFSAHNPRSRLNVVFERGRVALLSAPEDGRVAAPFELNAATWGCSSAMTTIDAAVPRLDAEGLVTYAHADFDEWYRNGPLGLEQGFTIRTLPSCAARGEPLVIRLRFSAVEGSIAEVSEDGRAALLSTPGERRIHYTDAFARDAAGVEHGVRISNDPALALVVDASHAQLPLTVDPLGWDIQQLIESNDFPGAARWAEQRFGQALGVSDRTLIVGAPGDAEKALAVGAAYVFTRNPNKDPSLGKRWEPQQKLRPAAGAQADSFGAAVAISGDLALVGAPNKDDNGSDTGAAYLYARSGTSWAQVQKLVPADAAAGSHFGAAVAIAGGTVVVGAPTQASGTLPEVGAAYVYGRAGSTWVLQRKLTPDKALAQAGLHFGAAVAAASATVAVGRDSASKGGVDWFTRTGAIWSATSNTLSSNVPHFGSALSMDENLTVIGAYGDASKGAETGAVTTVSTTAPTKILAQLIAPDGVAQDRFGFAVSLAESRLLVGAPGAGVNCVQDAGKVYVFTWNGSAWVNPQKRVDPTWFDCVTSCQMPLPAPLPYPTNSSNGPQSQRLGMAVAAVDNAILSGGPGRSEYKCQGTAKTGAVIEEEYLLSNASSCTTGDQCFSGYCVEGVCCKSSCDGPCRSCLADRKDPALSFGGDWVTGVCGEVKAGTDPKDGCTATGTFCGSGDQCSGYGSCVTAHPFGTPCGPTTADCLTQTSVASNYACSNYQCVPFFTLDCAPGYSCKNGHCASGCAASIDCAPGYECRKGACKLGKGAACQVDDQCSSGVCSAGKCCSPSPLYGCLTPPGEACASDTQCFTGHCVDGVCCDTGCDGPCQACALPDSPGTCSAVLNDPRDPAGSCAPEAGAGGEGGTAGESGAGGTSGDTQTDAGRAGESQGGEGGGGEGGAGGAGGASGASEAAGTGNVYFECAPACPATLVCDHQIGQCRDILVSACGCRAVGGRRTPLSSAGALLLLAAIAVRRRQRQ